MKKSVVSNIGGIKLEKHNISPVYDKNSKILILGSFPSVKSREEKFFYAHPQNRFWRVISYLFNEEMPTTMKTSIYKSS